MPRGRGFDALVLPGKILVDKLAGLKKQRQEHSRRRVTERELAHLHHKIDKLLVRLEEHEPEQAQTQDEECAICISAKATMQTFPCGHRVVCRKCFVKTIQMAVSQRLLPLRCVICRAKILRLKQLAPSGRSSSTTTLQQQHQPELLPAGLDSPYGRRLPEAGRNSRRPNSSHPYANPSSSSRRRASASRQPALLPIPETEELELVSSVQEQEQALCEEFEALSDKDDLKDAGDPLGKADHYQVVRWLSKFKRFKPPSILKGIRNRWKK